MGRVDLAGAFLRRITRLTVALELLGDLGCLIICRVLRGHASRLLGALYRLSRERHAKLLAEVDRIGAVRYENQVGETMQILVEGPSRRNKARMEGRTRCNRIVVFDGGERFRGQLVDLKIERAGSFTLYGDPAILN